MTSVAEEIDGYRKELREILGRGTDDDIRKGLRELAEKVGACTRTPGRAALKKSKLMTWCKASTTRCEHGP